MGCRVPLREITSMSGGSFSISRSNCVIVSTSFSSHCTKSRFHKGILKVSLAGEGVFPLLLDFSKLLWKHFENWPIELNFWATRTGLWKTSSLQFLWWDDVTRLLRACKFALTSAEAFWWKLSWDEQRSFKFGEVSAAPLSYEFRLPFEWAPLGALLRLRIILRRCITLRLCSRELLKFGITNFLLLFIHI